MRLVQQKAGDRLELVDSMLRVFRGGGAATVQGKKPTLRQRIEPARWLAERGFGKALQATEVMTYTQEQQERPLQRLTVDELRKLLKMADDRKRELELADGNNPQNNGPRAV